MCFHADERQADVTHVAATKSSQVAAAIGHADKDVSIGEQRFRAGLGEMIYQFLAHMMEIKRRNLMEKLAAKAILSPNETQRIKELKRTDAMVKSLLMMMREKSGAQFESFLTTLSETGQQSVADVVRVVLCTVCRTGHNPLHSTFGKPFSAAPSARSIMVGYWHENVVCLSVCDYCALWL